MTHRRQFAAALGLLAFATVLGAQSPRDRETAIHAVDGQGVFEGRLARTTRRWFEVETALGTRRVMSSEVGPTVDPAVLRERYAERVAAAKQDRRFGFDERIALARWCEHVGLTSGVEEQLSAILERDPERAEALEMIRRLAPAYRPAGRNVVPPEKSRWARREADLLWDGVGKAGFATAAILRERLGSLPSDLTLGRAVKLVEKGDVRERWVAAQVLGDSRDKRRVKPLFVSALNDPEWQVRQAAVGALKRHDDGTTIGPFMRVLLTCPIDSRRVFAAEGLGMLGDRHAVPALMRALKTPPDGGGVPKARANIAVLKQVAYVKDYDVEVAQSAFIADPIVDIAQEGAVLDVAVVAITVQRRTIGHALGRLTGQDFGGDVDRWSAWWDQHRAEF
ncbi:MAG: HEAT repeat domain-containing protein [Planctomycetota bacterium]